MKRAILILIVLMCVGVSASAEVLKVQVTKRCMFGDFDAIRHDMMYSSHDLLLSVESLDGKYSKTVKFLEEFNKKHYPKSEEEMTAIANDIQNIFKDLYSGSYVVDVLPKKLEDGVYIVTVCKDGDKEGVCTNKKIKDINEVLKAYEAPVADYKPEDVVYFYQVFNISQGKIEGVPGYKEEEISSFFSNISDKNVEKVKENLKVLLSNPLVIKGKEIVIDLPIFDKIKCGQ